MGLFDTEEWSKTGEALTQRGLDLDELNRKEGAGELGFGEATWRRFGTMGGALNDVVGGAFDFGTPDAITEPVGEAIGSGLTTAMDKTGAAEWMQKNPDSAANIMAGVEMLGVVPYAGALGKTAKLAAKAKGPEKGKRAKAAAGAILSSPSNYIPNFYGIDDASKANTLAESLFNQAITGVSLLADAGTTTVTGRIAKGAHDLLTKPRGKGPIAKKVAKVTGAVPNFLDKMVKKLPADGEGALALSLKITSFAKWGVQESAKALATYTVPQARALWQEQGVNQAGQKLIAKHLDNAATEMAEARAAGKPTSLEQTRSFQMATAQAIFMRYTAEQAGRQGPVSPDYDRIFEASTFGGIMPVDKSQYLAAVKHVQNVSFRKKTGARDKGPERAINVPDEVNEQAFDHVMDVWGMSPEQANGAFLVVKKPQGSGGDHASSVYRSKLNEPLRDSHAAAKNLKRKNAVVAAQQEAYDSARASGSTIAQATKARKAVKTGKLGKEPLTDVDLYNELTRLKPNGDRVYNVNMRSKSAADVEANGLWFTQSGSGRAIVEGGINRLTNMKAKGGVTSYISDEHNFLENMPILGKMLDDALPVREITMTPPISFNILNPSNTTRSFGSRATGKSKGKLDNTLVANDLEKLRDAKPTRQGINAERIRNAKAAGKGSLFAGYGTALQNDDVDVETLLPDI